MEPAGYLRDDYAVVQLKVSLRCLQLLRKMTLGSQDILRLKKLQIVPGDTNHAHTKYIRLNTAVQGRRRHSSYCSVYQQLF